jgi:hypothetical protein
LIRWFVPLLRPPWVSYLLGLGSAGWHARQSCRTAQIDQGCHSLNCSSVVAGWLVGAASLCWVVALGSELRFAD